MRKIGVIGCGMVGMSYVYALTQQEDDLEVVLIDQDAKYAEGQAMDLRDAAVLVPGKISIHVGTYKDLTDAKLVVITAGRPQKPGETRLQLIKDNAAIMRTIAKSMKDSGFNGITLIASNPVDNLTFVYQKESGFPRNKVIGSGTLLDSGRVKIFIARKLGIHPEEVDATIIGEHGESSVFLKSHLKIKGQSGSHGLSDADLDQCHRDTVQKAGKIIVAKRAAYLGIGVSLALLTHALLDNKKLLAPVGVFVKGLHGAPDVVIGYPALLGDKGVERVTEVQLTDKEKAAFLASTKNMVAALKEIGY